MALIMITPPCAEKPTKPHFPYNSRPFLPGSTMSDILTLLQPHLPAGLPAQRRVYHRHPYAVESASPLLI